ncbi:MAG: chromosome segregation protein SMC [Bacteroidetes bacterium]|nr:chromosome segregation protein SMC [Bacteroidota bacterium]
MELSKLEIKGFKSFGDKVVINFNEGVTGIVGPNGCGKSNIVDAIRWALGEQKTKTLRSEKMENLIFNGTKKRKPTQLAEVSLSFNNTKNILPTEYSQVTITRRYYRSGDSEYELNGVSCRLKDITNIFLDTGIASNSYAIIELKMVDDILNDKDNARRGLFEEAAGISKFKMRKKETLRKLGDTDADLERVEDLLFEIEKNLKSLQKQARQTERYFKLKEEYKQLSIELALKSTSKYLEDFENLSKKIQDEIDNKVGLTKNLNQKEADLEKDKSDLMMTEKQLSDKQKKLNQQVNTIRQYENDKQIKNERLRFLNDKTANLKEQIDHDKKSNERAAFSIKSLLKEKGKAQDNLHQQQNKLQDLKEKYENQKSETLKIQQEVNNSNSQFKVKQERAFQLNKEVEITNIQFSTLQKELEKTHSDSSLKSASLAEFENKVVELEQILDEKKIQQEKTLKQETDLQKRIEEANKATEVIQEELRVNTRKLDARQNEYNLTKSLVENLEGFPEAIKFLKKNSSWGKDAPLLSDIISCDEQYRVTIENFLEPVMNHYVVEDEAHAFEAVNLLNDASSGRASFFIMDSFKSYEPSATKIYQNTLPATEIVEFEGKYRKLISFILDNVYIVNGDIADIPEDENCVFITRSGKVTIKKHTIAGGSVGLFEGKRIGRAKNLEKLGKEIKAFDKKIDQIQQSLEKKQKELIQLKESTQEFIIERQRNEIGQINEQYIAIKTKKEQFSQLLSSNTTRKEDIYQQSQKLAKELKQLTPQAEIESKELKKWEDQINQLQAELNTANRSLNQKSTDYNQENILLHQLENKVHNISQEISFKESAYESSKQRVEANQQEVKNTDDEINQLIKKSEFNDDKLISMYAQKEQMEKEVNDVEKGYYSIRGEIDQTEKDLREIQRSRESVDFIIMELQNKLNDTKLELSSVKERLSVEFQVNLDQLIKSESVKLDSGEDKEALETKVHNLKEKIERIGPVNPMAMEAYEEIQERFNFISSQKEDLVKAKESLLTTIEEIDGVAKETFLEAFEKIKVNFVKVFRSLFSEEDDCDLRLADPDDPLESDIDIIAKPKGKKPLSINQLSGGEKSLTATSVLFAIYLLKPAPFCIFDEVDAPLDDTNIDKFNNIIRDFSKESQFIIITHNKRTMASTDIIYGITMAEQGVSKVVPVDLRELA